MNKAPRLSERPGLLLLFPFIAWFARLDAETLRIDTVAGITAGATAARGGPQAGHLDPGSWGDEF